jgi:uridine phosphorylase
MIKNSNDRTPNLRISPKDVASHALVVGDPGRVMDASKYMHNVHELGFSREYRTITGVFNKKKITISSHGVGSSGANVCFHELFRCGVRYIIRAGTCGAMKKEIRDGDLIIGSAAIREDGASEHLAPMSFPAVADCSVSAALALSAANFSIQPHEGIVLTQAYFYPGILSSELDYWLKTGLISCVEMEFATLLVMAMLNGVKAGGIFTSDGNLTEEANPNAYNPHRKVVEEGKQRMLQIALQALASLPD